MSSLPETPSGWLGSSERDQSLRSAGQRSAAARATGLLEGVDDPELRASFERTTNQVARFLNVPVALFSMIDGECQAIVSSTGYPGPGLLPSETSLCVHVRDSGRDVIVDDLSRHELGDVAGNMTAAGANAYLGTPVFGSDGAPIGSLCAIDFPSRSWEPSDLDLLKALAEGLTDKLALLQTLREKEEGEARLAATIEAIPNIVFVSNEAGEVTYVSPQIEHGFGIAVEQFLGRGWTDYVHPDDLRRVRHAEIDETSGPYETEFRLPARDGAYRPLLVRGVPIPGESGGVSYLSTATEIEGIRGVERQLAEERSRLTALLESLPHLVWISDESGEISYVGPQSREFLGYEPEELTGNVWAELIHPEDLPRVADLVMGLASRTEPFEIEYRLRRADGAFRWALARGSRGRREDGAVQWVCTATDIEQIRATERALASERARLGALMEAIPHIVVLSNPETGVDYVSPQIREILGYEPERMLGFGFYEHVIHPDDREALRARRHAFLGRPEPFEYEFRARHQSGAIVPMLLRGFPLPQVEGVVHSHVVTFTEIGAIRAAEERAEEERRRLRGVIDVLPAGLVLADETGRIALANEEARGLFGERIEVGVDDRSWPQAAFLDPDGTETPLTTADAPMVRALAGEPVRGGRTIRLRYENGAERFVKCDAEPLRRPTGEIAGVVMVASDITELRRAETRVEIERQTAAERMQAMLEGMPIWVGLVDLEGRLLAVNRAPVEAAGKTVEGVLGTVVWEEWTSGDPETTAALRETILAAARGERVTREMVYRWNGQEIETEYHAVPLRDADGNVTAISTSALDVSERNAARRRVEAEGELLRQIMANSPIMKGLCDAEGRVLYSNEAPLRAAGVGLEDVVGKPLWETPWTLDPSVREIVRDACRRAMAGETVLNELSFPSRNGPVEIEQRIAPIYGPDGELRYLLPSAMDVTARNAALRDVEDERARLDTIVDVLPSGLLIANAQGRITDANPEAYRLFGEPSNVNSPDAWPSGFFVEEDGTETPLTRETAPIDRALRGETVREPRTIRVVTPTGEERWLRCDAVPILDATGKLDGAVMTSLDVTEIERARREADRARTDSFDRLRRVIDSLPINVVLADREGRLLYANETPLRGAGLALEDVVGQLAWRSPWIGDEETARIVEEEYRRAAAGEIAKREFSIRMGETAIDIDHTVVPIRDDRGEVEFLLPSSIDVTARNEALRLAEDERRRLSETVEEMPVGLFVFDRDMKLLQANEEALKATGMTLERLDSGYLPQMWFVEPDGTEVPAVQQDTPSWRALRGENGREDRPMRFHHEDTSPEDDLYVRLEAAPLTDAGGGIVGAIVTAVDVKPLLEAEKALARERESATERLTATLEGISVFVGLLDLDGRLVWCNRPLLDATGFAFREVEGTSFSESPWFAHDPEMVRRAADAVRAAAAGDSAFTPIVVRRVGGFMDVDLSLAPIENEDGAVRYLVASGSDVTMRNVAMRQIEDARMSAERAREVAERATRAKDEFLAVLSHELRTPLTPAMLGLELLGGDLDEILPSAKDADLAASIVETMGSVRSNLEIQVRLIDDLLDVTRIARGKLELRKSPVDLHEAARHAVSIVAPRAAEKEILVEIEEGAPSCTILADPARLRQILWNLLANAVKFTDGGGRVRIETESAGPGTVRLKVVDSGVGIDPARLGSIFDAFDQGEGAISRGFGGLGLGLAIARSLARAHGGTLWASSAGRGHGATFVLELPTVEVDPEDETARAARQVRQRHPGCRVLLIEDNLDTARFTSVLLRRAEIEVEVAHSVRGAVHLARGKTFAAILTDIGLPDGDGVEAVQRLRGIGVQSPAIAMSGYGRDEDKARTADAGFRAHLVKPLAFDALLEALDSVLPESC